MRILQCSIVAFSFVFSTATVSGDMLIRRLPPDGAWARYYFSESWTDGTERTRWITIASVGTAAVGNEQCRWIEWTFEKEDGGQQKITSVFKFLILEEHLKAEGDPLAHVVKAWRRTREREPVEMKKNDVVALLPRLHLLLEGPPIQNLQAIEEKETIAWQKGKFECEVLLGTTRQEYAKVNYRLRLHPRMPFGVAAATLEVEDADFGETGTFEFVVTDLGTDAQSVLPTEN